MTIESNQSPKTPFQKIQQISRIREGCRGRVSELMESSKRSNPIDSAKKLARVNELNSKASNLGLRREYYKTLVNSQESINE